MTIRQYQIVFCRPQNRQFTVETLADRVGLHPTVIERFIACGLLEPSARDGDRLYFDATAVPRLHTIGRLRDNLGINIAGIAVVLDLLDKLRALQRENEVQRSRL
jgi:MerR family transcriptional regulator/heat shock protein HspR